MTVSAQTFISLVVIFGVFGAVLTAVAYCILLERKISAWVQDRIGPNRVGPMGLFQPLADGLKLFFKEDYNPRGVDRWLFLLAPVFILVPALIGWAIVPWGGVWDFPGCTLWSWVPILGGMVIEPGVVFVGAANVSVGIVYVLAVGSVGVYGAVLGGWSSNNKFSFLGGVRSTAQMISYEIPMGVAILVVLLLAGSLRPDVIIQAQVDSTWYLIAHPLAAAIMFISILAEANRAPFDLIEAEQELVGGFHTEYSSMKWALFFFAEYSHMITASAIFTVLFLGGWQVLPFVPQSAMSAGILGVLLKVTVLVGKVAGMIVLMMLIRWTLPRFRFDQLMSLAWRMLIPLSIVLLVATAIMVHLGRSQWWWMLGMNIVVIAVGLAIQPLLPKGRPTNLKVGIAGSRFSPPIGQTVAISEGN